MEYNKRFFNSAKVLIDFEFKIDKGFPELFIFNVKVYLFKQNQVNN